MSPLLRPALAGLLGLTASALVDAQSAGAPATPPRPTTSSQTAAAAPGQPGADLPPALAAEFSKGVAALAANQLDAAEASFRAVLTAGGDRASVHHNLGIVEQRRGRHAVAIAAFQRASRLAPDFGPSRLLAGSSLLALGRVREAVAELRQAVRLLPNELAARRQLADALERAGDLPGLVDQYRRIVELAPGNGEYEYRLGKAYLKLAQWSIERMRAIDPKTARLPQSLGLAYLEQDRADLAAAAFEEAARLDPTLPEVQLALARIHLDQGRWDEAARAIDRELALVPDSAAARELKTRIDAARSRP